MSAETIISVLGTTFVTVLEKLSQSQLIVHRGATVFHKSSEIEYAYHITIGSMDSRPSKILKVIQDLINKPVEFSEVTSIFGYGLPHNENLVDLGIIHNVGTQSTVDFGKMVKVLKSDLVILSVRKKLPEVLKQKLVVAHLGQTSRYINDQIETDLEVALDYADLWRGSYEQFTVREIEFAFTLEIMLDSVIEHIPQEQRKKIIKAAKAIMSGNKDAVQYLKIMSDNFLTFQQDEKIKQLQKATTIEPSEYFKIRSITPKMQSCEIATVGYPMILPGSMKVTIECRLDGKNITQIGVLRINLKEFGKVLKDIVESISKQGKSLTF